MHLIAGSFSVLGCYLGALALHKMIVGGHSSGSPLGIAFMTATVAVMFLLYVGKDRTAQRLHSSPLHANAHLTAVDSALATGVLVALVCRTLLDWQVLDPLAAGLVAVAAFYEAWSVWTGRRNT